MQLIRLTLEYSRLERKSICLIDCEKNKSSRGIKFEGKNAGFIEPKLI